VDSVAVQMHLARILSSSRRGSCTCLECLCDALEPRRCLYLLSPLTKLHISGPQTSTVPYLIDNPEVGYVQARWVFANPDESYLTKVHFLTDAMFQGL
jgi:hypothetical protein